MSTGRAFSRGWRIRHGVGMGVAFHVGGEEEKASLTCVIGALRPKPLPCAYLCFVPVTIFRTYLLFYGQPLIGLTLRHSWPPFPQLPVPVAFLSLPLVLPGLSVLPLPVLPLPSRALCLSSMPPLSHRSATTPSLLRI